MAVKLRLSRQGRKGIPFYRIVAADSTAPRDGKYIETLGIYDPRSIPAVIEIDQQKALNWLEKGAQPTETMRAVLKYKGILFKRHLQKGVILGKLTQEVADKKYALWEEANNRKIISKREGVLKSLEEKRQTALVVESKRREQITQKVMAKRAVESEKTQTAAIEAAVEAKETLEEVAKEAKIPENPS
ncbi:MAG: 30S ribosomal protein S16 [Bacteroidetes bacterium RIFCSPLOWO2_02_FULL_36_8]|nr:MAG: 30S ribosomal protein S16 [Bacteroidetes bacterium RIFCSPLOWO2_02_FULL_36_8]OFY71699.1 MAG: 30S ribosomal protein S16 [Bacteroidetes bacterium RIFCSPLOWO2_12_FULL_37_12]